MKTNQANKALAAIAFAGHWDALNDTDFYLELTCFDRYDIVGDDNDARDYKKGVKTYGQKLDQVNKALTAAGYKGNAYFELGEKGDFAIIVRVAKA